MSIEEVGQFLETNETALSELLDKFPEKSIKALSDKGFVVRSKEEDVNFLKNYETNVLPSALTDEHPLTKSIADKTTFKIATAIEEDVFKATGIPKLENEKYHAYLKRSFQELQEKQKGGQETDDRLNVYKTENEQLKQQLEQTKQDFDKKLLDYRNSEGVKMALNSVQLAYPSSLTTDEEKAEYAKMTRAFIESQFKNEFEVKATENGLAYYQDGKLMLNTNTNSYLTPKDIIEQRYKVYLATEKPAAVGVGSSKPNAAVPSGKMTREEFSEYAAQKKYQIGSREYVEKYKEYVLS